MAFGLVPAKQLAKYGSSLTIEETTPAGPGFKPRRVTLLGPSLPFQGAEWGFENKLSTIWYPGNREATQQNLGPRELPSAWEGEWNRTLMGRVPTLYVDEAGTENRIVSPHVLRTVLEDIFRAGVTLRVVWAVQGTVLIGNPQRENARDDNYTIARTGRVGSFRTPIARHTDIKWNIEFVWKGRGAATDRVASVRKDQDLAKVSNGLDASIAASVFAANIRIVSNTPANRLSATRFTLGQLENLAGAPLRAVQRFTRQLQSVSSKFKQVGDIVRKLRSTPYAISNTVVDFARNTTAIANSFISDLGRQPPERLSNKAKVSSLLRATNYFAGVSNAAILNARRGAELDLSLRQILVAGANRGALSVRSSSTTRAGDVLAVHVCKTGDTPQRISTKFFGNPDQGAAILRANRLPLYTPTFRPGQILIVPALSNAAAQRTSTV